MFRVAGKLVTLIVTSVMLFAPYFIVFIKLGTCPVGINGSTLKIRLRVIT